MKPDYVATKTAWRAITFWRIVFFLVNNSTTCNDS